MKTYPIFHHKMQSPSGFWVQSVSHESVTDSQDRLQVLWQKQLAKCDDFSVIDDLDDLFAEAFEAQEVRPERTYFTRLHLHPTRDDMRAFLVELAESPYAHHIDDDVDDIIWTFDVRPEILRLIKFNLEVIGKRMNWDDAWSIFADAWYDDRKKYRPSNFPKADERGDDPNA